MKVGDIVRQNGNLMQMKKAGKIQPPPKTVGVVIDIREHPPEIPEKMKGWVKRIGRGVDVLWSSGKLTENMAENSLDVLHESG
jgi:hypothetical protein